MSAEHRPKRLRSIPPPTLDEACNCYLGTVPDEILRLVLRFLSTRPHHQHWHAYISADSVNTALDVGGALGRAASMEFDIIGDINGIVIPRVAAVDEKNLRPFVYRLPLRGLVLRIPKMGFYDYIPTSRR